MKPFILFGRKKSIAKIIRRCLMKRYVILILILVPALLFAACGDKTRVMKVSAGEKTWLGVSVKNLSDKMLKDLDLDSGVEVIKVYEGSPAQKAGLEKEDILISYDGKDIDSADDLVKYVGDTEIDQTASIQFLRDGKKQMVDVTIGERKAKSWVYKKPHKSFYFHDRNDAWLGVRTTNLSDQLRKYFGAPEELGVLIEEVLEDSPAKTSGLQAGDVIIRVGEKKINDTRDLVRAINYFDPEDKVEIELIRDKDKKTLTVKLGKNKGHKLQMFGVHPEMDFDVFVAPDLEYIPEDIDIEIDPEDLEELESVNEVLREKIEIHMEELDEKLESLDDKIKRISVRVGSKII
jgi:predicted metalloprotease with PDZ domain